MVFSRSLVSITLQALFLLVTLSHIEHQVSAQFGLSVACNDCLVSQIGGLPSCTGVNLTSPDVRSNPQYKTCLCDSSFDFGWTSPCSTKCQANELSNFQGNYANLLKSANLTCVKPTPSPTATSTATPKSDALTMRSTTTTTLGWIGMVSTVLCLLLTL